MENNKYEILMEELETISKKLSGDNISMDDMVRLYERGMEVARQLTSILDSYDARIEKVTLQHLDNEG